MSDDLPYRVEYAKSGRASCKVCKSPIGQGTLRMATVVQSPFHDGKMERWHHLNCFFIKQRPKTVGDIAHFDNIRWEDQENIKKKIEQATSVPAPVGKGKKRGAGKANNAKSDFCVELAKSNRSKCRGCEETIVKGEIRISKKDYESEEARRFGGLDRWHHVECFSKLRSELQFFDQGDKLPGAASLSEEEKNVLKKALPKMKAEDCPPPSKKLKAEPKDDDEEKEIKAQNKKIFSMRDHLSMLKKSELTELLEHNKQEVPEGKDNILDMLADMLVFGALKPCPKCKGQLMYQSGLGYKCTGDVSEWAKCENVTQNPDRKKATIPSSFKKEYSFLKSYKASVVRRALIVKAPSTISAVKKEEDQTDGPKIQGKPRPLKHMQFAIIGKTKKDKEELKRDILLLGGSVGTKLSADLAAVISNEDEVEKMNKRMVEVQELDIHVVSEDFVEEVKESADSNLSSVVMLIKNKNICSWGGDLSTKISKSVALKSAASGKKSQFEKSASGIVKMRVKGGGAIDPDSGLEDVAHVHQNGKDKYTVTLGLTDIQTKKNSYYKLQILKHDKKPRYWLFRSWGRIGTTIGDKKCEEMALEDCIKTFETLYEDKTGNMWRNREHFQKVPHRMYPIDVDHGDDETDSNLLKSDIESKLKKPIQELMQLIFDVSKMKKAMLEFEIDMDKMPLGKLSKKQIKEAYQVLSEILTIVKSSNPERVELIAASNKFYTLIPHDFGVREPTIIDTEAEIETKSLMLDSLSEMEVAYSLLHSKTDGDKNPLDGHYEQLNTEIDVLERDSQDFLMIEKYVKNTHAETHTAYELEVLDVFTIKRNGEDKKYKPFKKLPNRKLLWHGSRITNFAGILSQGLRIAPPEAPCTGYMFGKGVYFADMVSKSANYCCTSSQNPTGLLLLCDVALGNMYERFHADYIQKLPNGKHSTWGRGMTQPDPEKSHKTKDGMEVPYGSAVKPDLSSKSSLLYNEYIVYDVGQIKIEYLVKLNFKYKY